MKANTLKHSQNHNICITMGLILLLSFFLVLGFANAAYAYSIDLNGGDCATRAGDGWKDNWDQESLTCTLGADVTESIVISSSGITLDGGGNYLTGDGTGSGIYIQSRTSFIENVTVINLTVTNFFIGVDLHNNRLSIIYNNNFINNGTHVRITTDSLGADEYTFSKDPPIGGNYWDKYDCIPDGGFCTTDYEIDIYQKQLDGSSVIIGTAYDYYPWAAQSGWKAPLAIPVAIDIKPGSCPNPINTRSHGVTPVAILGAAGFDVRNISLLSLRLEGVPPIRSAFVGVATPYHPWTDDNGCNELGDDGYEDLILMFKTKEIVDALEEVEEVNDGDVIPLTLTGELNNGTEISGTDNILIVKMGRDKNKKLKKFLKKVKFEKHKAWNTSYKHN